MSMAICGELGVDSCVKLFKHFKSDEGLYFFLRAYLSSSKDPEMSSTFQRKPRTSWWSQSYQMRGISMSVAIMDQCLISSIIMIQQHGPVHWRLCPKGQSIECSFRCGPTNRRWIPRRLHQGSHLDSQVSTASGASCATNWVCWHNFWNIWWVTGVKMCTCTMVFEKVSLIPTTIQSTS